MKRKAEPLLPFRRERIVAAGILALLSPVPLLFSYTLSPQVYFVWAVLLGAQLLLAARGRALVLPNWALNLVGFAVLVVVFRLRFSLGGLLRTAIVLLLVTTAVKFASIRREGDLSLLLLLSAFLFVGSLATSSHVSILLFVALYAAVAWTILAKWSLWSELALAPDEWRRPGARGIPGAGRVALAVGGALVAAIPFFVLLPRIRAPYMRGMPTQSREVWTGFTESVDPGEPGVLKQSEHVYLRIQTDVERVALNPLSLRLRTLAFSRWDGKRWTKSHGVGAPLSGPADTFVSLIPRGKGEAAIRGKLVADLSPLGSRCLPISVNGVGLRLAGSAFRRGGSWFERDALSDVLLPFIPEQNVQYEILLAEVATPDLRPPAPDDLARRPEGSSAIRRFVLERAGEPGNSLTAEQVAGRLARYLSTSYGYSLEIPLRGEKPVEDFLFRNKRGHCEAFATAMAVALREVGIPTRLVTGFLGGEAGLFGGTWLVRGKNAHAWVEAWCGPEKGWLLFDPTPEAGRPVLEQTSLVRQLRNLGENVEFLYDRWVLSFGEADQGELARGIREIAASAAAMVVRAAGRIGRNLPVLAAALVLALVGLVGGILLLGRRRGAAVFSLRGVRLGPGPAAYRKLQRQLRKRGMTITAATAPEETLAFAATLGPRVTAAVSEVVGLYIAESFGGRSPSRSERDGLVRLVKEMRRLLGRDRTRRDSPGNLGRSQP